MTSSAAVCSFNCFSLGKRTTVFLCATLLALSFLLCMGGVAADSHEEAGTITSDTMWVEGDTYNITGMLYVQAGATLTIPQDVTVLFDEYAGIVVNGTLVVAGIDGHPVIFDGNPRPTSGPDGSVSEKVIYPGYWDGIRINGGQASISFANFRAAAAAVNATGSDGISVLNSTFMDVPYAIVLSSCDDAVVSGNTIVGPDAPAPGTYPVHPYVLRAITLHSCSGAAVSENTITRSGPYAISMDGTGGTLGDITIAGNIIEASDGYGIRIYANSDVGNVIISDNRVGNSTGIGMFIFAYNFGGVTIEGNYVWNGTSGVYLSTSGSFDRIDVIGNEIWNSTGAPVDSYGITIFAPVGLGDVTISGNYIWNNVGNGTVVNGGAFGDVIIEGNIVENNRGNGVIFTGNGFGSVTINGNIVTGNGIGGIKKYTGFYMEGTYCGNISVAGNNISANGWNGLGIWCFGNFSKIEIFGNTASDNGNAGMAFWGYGYGNVTITGNTASRNGNDGIYVGGGEEIAPNTYRNNGFRDVTIAGNVLDGNGGDGIQAGLGNWGSGYCYNGGFGKVTILDNKVRGNHYNGIKVGGNEFDGIIIIKNNIITGNGIGGSFAGLYVEGGTLGDINITGNNFSSNSYDGIGVLAIVLGDVLIDGNTANGNDGCGIAVFTSTGTIGDVILRDNKVRGNADTGICLQANLDIGSITAAHNTVSENDDYGIDFYSTFGRIGDVTLLGNVIEDNGEIGIRVDSGIGLGDVMVRDNVVTGNDEGGIFVLAYNGSIGDVAIEDNALNGNGGAGFRIGGGDIFDLQYETQGIGDIIIRHNTFQNSTGDGVYFEGDVFGNVTVHDNTASNNSRSGIRFRGNASGDVSIENNRVGNNTVFGIGLKFDTVGNVDIRNNQAWNNSNAGIRFEGDVFGNVTVADNKIWDSKGYGVQFAGGTFTNVTVRHNTVENSENHGIWFEGSEFGNVTFRSNTVMNSGDDGMHIASSGDIHNVKVLDNIIGGSAGYGIYLSVDLAVGNVTATGNIVTENGYNGILFTIYYAHEVFIGSNHFHSNDGGGIFVSCGRVGNATVSNNCVADCAYGSGIFYWADNTGNLTVVNNIVEGNGGDGVCAGGAFYGVLIASNAIENNGDDGIDLNFGRESTDRVIIERNEVRNNCRGGIAVYISGYTSGGSYFFSIIGEIVIANNILESNGVEDYGGVGSGIRVYAWLAGIDYLNITCNEVIGSQDRGIFVDIYGTNETFTYRSYVGGLLIRGNTVMNSGDDGIGIWAELSNIWDLTICSNVICSNGGGGIRLGGEDAYLDTIAICENEINGSGDDGIEASGSIFSHSIAIERNIVENSNGDGICIDGSDGYPSNVVIGNNTVLSNHGDGIYVLFIEHLDLYNGEINNNLGWGVYASDVKEAHWFIDLSAMVRNNGVLFSGDVIIDGTMSLKGVEHFLVNYENDNGSITVNEAGTLNVLNSNIGTTAAGLSFGSDSGILEGYLGYYGFDVYGALDLNSVKVGYAVELYLGPTAVASIRSSSVYSNLGHGIMIDGCAPIILDSSFASNGAAGVFITGEGADPLIVGNMFIMNQHGILANDADLGNVIGNIFFMNALDGISVVNTASGNIVGNTFLLNKVEISVDGSTVSITGNRIGYSPSFDMYAIFSAMTLLGYPEHGNVLLYSGSAEMIYDLMTSHVGISMTDSTVTTSGNSYGMLVTAISATGSVLYFGDDILLPSDPNEMVKVPYYSMDNSPIARAAINLWTFGNASLPLAIKNGISAAGSEVHVSGSTIQVLNIAIFLDTSRATITDSSLSASGVGLFLFRASAATVDGSDIGTVQQDATSSVSHLWGVICGIIKDEGGSPIAGATVELSDGRTATTDANGHFEFDEIASGTYTLTVTKDGYKVLSQNLSAAVGEGRDLGTLSLQALGKAGGDTPLGLGILAVVIAAGVLGVALYSRKRQN